MHANESSLRRRRSKQRGLTLVEVMIVVVILGLIATGTAIAVFRNLDDAKQKLTRGNAGSMRSVARMWLSDHSDRCPAPQELLDAKLLDRGGSIADAWGSTFEIVCDEGDVTVVSLGPDKRKGTEDDIHVPSPKG